MNIRLIHFVLRRSAVGALTAAAVLGALVGGSARAQSGSVTGNTDGVFTPGTRVVSASSVPTAADLTSDRLPPGGISTAVGSALHGRSAAHHAAPRHQGCQSCMRPGCGGNCNVYGGAFESSVACGVNCDPYNYIIVEGLYLERQGEDSFSLSRNATMGDFDFEWTPRITVGMLPNCVNGYEFTWVGPVEWERSLTLVDPAGGLDSLLFDGDGTLLVPNNFDGTLLDPFQNANVHTQFYNSEYWSGELNRTISGWDVAKVLCGGRFIRLEEDYGFASQDGASFADLTSRTENNLVGIQAGLDLLYPVARHLYTDFRGRAGAYVNFVDSDVRLRNQGESVIHAIRDDEEIAGVFEIGGGLRYQLGEMLSIRAGGELWYITQVATAADQINPAVTNALGNRIEAGEDIFYYGAVVSAEVRF